MALTTTCAAIVARRRLFLGHRAQLRRFDLTKADYVVTQHSGSVCVANAVASADRVEIYRAPR
jgi:hypothetical protein